MLNGAPRPGRTFVIARLCVRREAVDERGALEEDTERTLLVLRWPVYMFPETKKETRGSPALCVSGNFQGKQRVFGAQFWKLASFPD